MKTILAVAAVAIHMQRDGRPGPVDVHRRQCRAPSDDGGGREGRARLCNQSLLRISARSRRHIDEGEVPRDGKAADRGLLQTSFAPFSISCY